MLQIDNKVIESLLIDRTTKKNIRWATREYKKYGSLYTEAASITIDLISGRHSKIIRPRVMKNRNEQNMRARYKAEVFTPSWMCNKQNNQIDLLWFEGNVHFNEEIDGGWKTNHEKIKFPSTKKWTDYVDDIRLEISCGEAPYLVSVYDSVSGESISVQDRIGILDRKIRIINENAPDSSWFDWVKRAYMSVYGFEYQGDNLLIARINLMRTFIDYYFNKFNETPNEEMIGEISEIITWNIWQMDGVKYVVPLSCRTDKARQTTLFGEDIEKLTACSGCETDNIYKHNGIYSKIMDWHSNKKVKFIDLLGKEK